MKQCRLPGAVQRSHTAELGDYRQEVTVTTVAGSTYLDEGNAVAR